MDENKRKRVAVIGAGLVGSLDAIYFAKAGFDVHVFELRSDPRTAEIVEGRSINLALSVRGREALRAVGAEDEIVKNGTPVYARMIHSLDGSVNKQPYGKADQYILSIERRMLNENLIRVSEKVGNITYHFDHKLTDANFDKGIAYFEDMSSPGTKKRVEFSGDFIAGNDGAYSNVRRLLMKKIRMNYKQEFIPHGYKEIEMLPTANNEYKMEPGCLHIWPRNTFMMMALANKNKTFTCTLFLPFDVFEKLNPENILDFFEREFPDAIPLIGREQIVKEYKKNPVGPLISIKCNPYHYADKCVLKGDAAHAMVPFYGQGMNCGLEDCLVFHGILEKHGFDFAKALPEFSTTRNPDAEAICDLAMYNYVEMRSKVNSRFFLFMTKINKFLNWLLPRTWIPLYTMVSFTRIPYHTVIEKRRRQDKILNGTLISIAVLTCGASACLIWKNGRMLFSRLLDKVNWNAILSAE